MKFFLNLSAGFLLSTAVFLSPVQAMDTLEDNSTLSAVAKPITVAILAPHFYADHMGSKLDNIHPAFQNSTTFANSKRSKNYSDGTWYLADNHWYVKDGEAHLGCEDEKYYYGSKIVDKVLSVMPNAMLLPFDYKRAVPSLLEKYAYLTYDSAIIQDDFKNALTYKPDVLIFIDPFSAHFNFKEEAKGILYFQMFDPSSPGAPNSPENIDKLTRFISMAPRFVAIKRDIR